MAAILFDVVVQPLVLLIELVFSAAHRLLDSPGGAVVCVSLAVNLLCLPLYRMADEQQDREREKQKSMERWVSHIKRHFRGDERYMMLSAYYAEQGYHPARALLGSLSLLLQIPFFMAAYSYLSHLTVLQGASFLFLPDLGAPDALLSVGGLTVNVMPVAMTVLNCASTAVYTRGLPMRDKVQAYGLAAVFLVLLYDSPSGLVFYWTCNQLFSLGKNVFMKVLPNPERWAQALAELCACGALAWLVLAGKLATFMAAASAITLFIAFQVVMLLWVRKSREGGAPADDSRDAARGVNVTAAFFLGAALLSVLLGLLVPSAVIADSPTEFMRPGAGSPLSYIVHATCVWAGTFVLWAGTYFMLSGPRGRRAFALAMWCACGACVLQYFAFGQGLGTISNELIYDNGVSYEFVRKLLNLAALAGVVVALALLWRKVPHIVTPALAVGTIAIAALSVPNVAGISSSFNTFQQKTAADESLFKDDGTPKQILHLSKTKKNVVVLFMDRAISGYVPYLMNERPELAQKLDGFTYYPDTLSFGVHTNFAAPALYGGYEYMPTAMDARPDKTIPQKHNEALLLMPTLFSEEGYRTTVVDPPYAGDYKLLPDLSLYDDLANTEAYYTNGAYTDYDMPRYGISTSKDMNRQFVMYGLMRALPECLQETAYDNGRYWTTQEVCPIPSSTRDSISTLDVLPEITSTDDEEGSFVLLCNDTTHSPSMLQLPDYELATTINNEGLEDYSRFVLNGRRVIMDTELQLAHYHVNMATYLKLGTFFDWMRNNGVYDNTRIIIVADHGYHLDQFEGWRIGDLGVMAVNPTLMVKDFDAHGFTTSDEFMTNADVPSIALEGIVDDPVNPATGNAVTTDEKGSGDLYVTNSLLWEVEENNGYTFDTSDAPWYSVHDSIFDLSNWKMLEGHPNATEQTE